jgi:hypothetical protein
MKAKEFTTGIKPRNFVAKNAIQSGAGAHKDKKKSEKQGDVKHKKEKIPMESVAEGQSQHSDMSIAQDVYAENPDLDSEDDILKAAFPHVVKMMGGNKKRANYMFNYDEDFPGEMIGAYKWLQRQAHDVGEDITMERDRDPDDWDEGNTEPPNNFAVYINGKKWKVFAGRGTYADDYREKAHYQQLRAWADKKSAATGKKWTVSPTGEPATA